MSDNQNCEPGLSYNADIGYRLKKQVLNVKLRFCLQCSFGAVFHCGEDLVRLVLYSKLLPCSPGALNSRIRVLYSKELNTSSVAVHINKVWVFFFSFLFPLIGNGSWRGLSPLADFSFFCSGSMLVSLGAKLFYYSSFVSLKCGALAFPWEALGMFAQMLKGPWDVKTCQFEPV